jgi:hypothetical protein
MRHEITKDGNKWKCRIYDDAGVCGVTGYSRISSAQAMKNAFRQLHKKVMGVIIMVVNPITMPYSPQSQ